MRWLNQYRGYITTALGILVGVAVGIFTRYAFAGVFVAAILAVAGLIIQISSDRQAKRERAALWIQTPAGREAYNLRKPVDADPTHGLPPRQEEAHP